MHVFESVQPVSLLHGSHVSFALHTGVVPVHAACWSAVHCTHVFFTVSHTPVAHPVIAQLPLPLLPAASIRQL